MKILALFRQLSVFALIISTTTFSFSQTTQDPSPGKKGPTTDQTLERAALISDLQSLERETLKFNDPLAEALAKAEIADAAWQLDKDWAKKLIRAAYELTIPKTDERSGQDRPAGSPPPMPNAADRSRWKVRFRVLAVARRDKEFANELTQMGQESVGAYGRHFASAALADQALEAGDVSASADYIMQGIKADPTQGTAPDIINRIAVRDRAMADRLVLQYVGELRRFPISPRNQSDIRSFRMLSDLMMPSLFHDLSIKVPAPGPEVMRAYVGYMLEAFNNLEQQEPGYLVVRRATLLSLWVPLQQYAPEMASAFLNLESRSRNPGDKLSLPTAASTDEERRRRYERNVKKELDGDQPQEAMLYSAIGRGDFEKARKLIDKLPDGAGKKHFIDAVNAEEALRLLRKGNIYEAERLAKELTRGSSMSRVYPPLISKCVAGKDQACANRLVSQALKQIKDSDTSPPPIPEGIPASAVAGDPRFDQALSFIAGLALDILPAGDDLAFNVLDEFVSVANNAPLETEKARIGFDVSVFKTLAPRNETHVEQAAYSLRNPVQRVLALASIYQWKAKELTKRHP